MTSHVIRTEADLANFTRLLRARRLPVTVSVASGARRSTEQNRLQRLWMNEIGEQLGMTPEEARGYCKLTIGVPIMRENDEFRERYDSMVKPLPYETKVALMMEPFDFAVTRHMTTEQKARYLDEIQRHFAQQGVMLTQPEVR